MAKKPFTPTEEGNAADAASIPPFVTIPDEEGPPSLAAPAPLPEALKSAPAVIKPGVRRISLAQARAHHAAKLLPQV